MPQTLQVGSKAPDFSCAADGDRQVSLADYAGKKLVIYFYPKDDTPGCTTEAIEFTAKHDAFVPNMEWRFAEPLRERGGGLTAFRMLDMCQSGGPL